MRRFDEYATKGTDFWATVKYVSELSGYSRDGRVSTHSIQDIENALLLNNLFIDSQQIADVKRYLDLRADLLNTHVKSSLMDTAAAKFEYEKLSKIHSRGGYLSR